MAAKKKNNRSFWRAASFLPVLHMREASQDTGHVHQVELKENLLGVIHLRISPVNPLWFGELLYFLLWVCRIHILRTAGTSFGSSL